MTYHKSTFRSAMTAIAAVLALSSTPLFAQDAGVPDPVPETTAEPVTETPDPLAPEPAVPEAPVITDTANEAAKASEPATKTIAVAKSATRRSAATASSPTRSSGATTTAPAPIAAPAAGELIDAPIAAPAEVAPVAPTMPTSAETASVDQALEMDNMLELAGAAGAGLLALVGAGMALRSRRRRKEEERAEEAKWAIIEALPDPESQVEREPAFTRTPAPMHDVIPAKTPVQANGPATELPDGFDLSSFGPHVRAAYRGPTPDNPSVSLEYRLRRATFLDQKEQDKEAAARPAAQAPAKPAWAQPAHTGRSEAKFMLRRAGSSNGAKPAFQR